MIFVLPLAVLISDRSQKKRATRRGKKTKTTLNATITPFMVSEVGSVRQRRDSVCERRLVHTEIVATSVKIDERTKQVEEAVGGDVVNL